MKKYNNIMKTYEKYDFIYVDKCKTTLNYKTKKIIKKHIWVHDLNNYYYHVHMNECY